MLVSNIFFVFVKFSLFFIYFFQAVCATVRTSGAEHAVQIFYAGNEHSPSAIVIPISVIVVAMPKQTTQEARLKVTNWRRNKKKQCDNASVLHEEKTVENMQNSQQQR